MRSCFASLRLPKSDELGRWAVAPAFPHLDAWTLAANLWDATVGTPGAKKTPAASEARLPLRRLSAEAREAHGAALSDFEIEKQADEYEAEGTKSGIKIAVKGGASRAEVKQMLATEQSEEIVAPTMRRYEVNDATVEALGERLRENPNGLLVYRDEFSRCIKSLDKQGHENDTGGCKPSGAAPCCVAR